MTSPTTINIKQILTNNRDKILAIASKHGAFNVRIFGSVARGEADDQSDIDILVDYSIDKITPWFPTGLILDLEELLERKVDVATEGALKKRIKEKVLQEAIPL
jgi:predicted nucleotidyltransferase